MTGPHEPTNEFRTFLEWQVMTKLRRQSRFAKPVLRGHYPGLKTAGLVVLSLLLGAAGVTATAQIQEAQQKEQLITVLNSELQLAEMRYSLARGYLEEAKRYFEAGLVKRETVENCERDLRLAEAEVARVRLNIEEVQVSGMPPQDGTTAPKVGDRDFVSERLKLDFMVASQQEAAAAENLREAERRFEAGLVTELNLREVQAEAMRATGEMMAIKEKMAIREQFLAGSLDAEEAARRRMLIAAQNQLTIARSLLAIATQKFEIVRKMYEAGEVGELELLRAQVDMLTRQTEVEQIQLHVSQLQQANPPPNRP